MPILERSGLQVRPTQLATPKVPIYQKRTTRALARLCPLYASRCGRAGLGDYHRGISVTEIR